MPPEPWEVPIMQPPLPPQPKPQWVVVTVKDQHGNIHGAFTAVLPQGQPVPAFYCQVQHLY